MAAMLVAAACSSGPEAFEADAPRVTDIKALRWIAPEADRLRALTVLPASCEAASVGEDAATRRLGKLAFESPALLGGAAARMGLSCSSCHLNGRDNPDFFIQGVSGAPGTADVTSSLFSKVRGDGDFNPTPIPDIGMRNGKQIRDRKGAEFREKVRGLIVEEFDGQPPPSKVFDAVIAYLDGLDPSACADGELPVRLVYDLDAAETAYEAALAPGDAAMSLFYLRVARFRLERIHERLGDPRDKAVRKELVALSGGLGELAESIRTGNGGAFIEPDWTGLHERLQFASDRSFYDPQVLRTALDD